MSQPSESPDRIGGASGVAALHATKPRKSLTRTLREWLVSLAFVLAIMVPVRSSLADWNDVPSGSMRPTILEGERVFVNKLAYGLRVPLTRMWLARWGTPSRGDIVTFASPKDGQRLVKRVIGLPGDRVAMRSNTLYINGEPMARQDEGPGEPNRVNSLPPLPTQVQTELLGLARHAITLTPSVRSPSTFSEVVVPEGECFVLGDNRDVSADSRFIGFVPLTSIYGRATAVLFSVDPEHWYMPRWSRCATGLR